MTAKTPVFGIEYLLEGEPVRATRGVLERNAAQVEAALLRGPASPPLAQDLNTLTGLVGRATKPRVFVDAAPAATFTPPGPLTVHAARTIDPVALFGAGMKALVMVDARVLLDSNAGAATKWDFSIASPALTTGGWDTDSRSFAGRGTMHATYSVEIAVATSFSTFLAAGTGASAVSYPDARNNRARYTVFPVTP